MFLKFGSAAKIVSSVVLGGSIVAVVIMANNPYISKTVSNFIGEASLVRYSEMQEVEDSYKTRLSTKEDMEIYAKEKGCTLVLGEGVGVRDDVKRDFLYKCKKDVLVKFEIDEVIPKTGSKEFYDYKQGRVRRVCSGGEMIKKWFVSVDCAYDSERRALERARIRDSAWMSDFWRRKGTYKVKVVEHSPRTEGSSS